MKKTIFALLISSLAPVAWGQAESEPVVPVVTPEVLDTSSVAEVPTAVNPMVTDATIDPVDSTAMQPGPNNYTASVPETPEADQLPAAAHFGAEFWFSPRHGDLIVQKPELRTIVQRLLSQPDAFLVVAYPEGESGELWGLEMQAWLIALGVSSDRIELRASMALLESVTVSLAVEGSEADGLAEVPDQMPTANGAEAALIESGDESDTISADTELQQQVDPVVETPMSEMSLPEVELEAIPEVTEQ